jgi:hypothetical protein
MHPLKFGRIRRSAKCRPVPPWPIPMFIEVLKFESDKVKAPEGGDLMGQGGDL